MIPLLGAAAKAVLAKVGPSVAKAIGGILGGGGGKTVAKTVGGAIVTAGAAAAGAKVVKTGNDAPPPPPLPGGLDGGYATMSGTPGTGVTAYAGSPGNLAAQAVMSGAIPMTAPPQFVQQMKAPAGYVLVRLPDGRGVSVLKEVAYALGLKKRPRKTTAITHRDMQGARKVQNFITRHSVKRTPKTPLKRIGKGKR